MLPCFVGDRQPALRRVTEPIDACATDLWVLTPPDLRETVRINTVFRALQQELEKLAPLLAGLGPRVGRQAGIAAPAGRCCGAFIASQSVPNVDLGVG